MIDLPDSRPEQIVQPEGDADAADRLAQTLFTTAQRFDEFGEEAIRLLRRSEGAGEAVAAYARRAQRVAREQPPMAGAVRRVARTVVAYADNLRAHLATSDELRERQRLLDSRRAERSREVTALERDPLVSVAAVRALEERSLRLRAEYAELVHDEARLRRHVSDNERLMRESFESADTREEALTRAAGRTDLARHAVAGRGSVLDDNATADEQKRWWAGLSHAEREAVIAGYPGAVGNAEGPPWSARDQANRIRLDDQIARLGAKETDGTLSPREVEMLVKSRETLARLEGSGGQLIEFRPGDGAVRIAPPA